MRLVQYPDDTTTQSSASGEDEFLGESPYDIYYDTLRDLGIDKSEDLNKEDVPH